MQLPHVFRITFAEHMKLGEVEGMASTFNYGGEVSKSTDGRTFTVKTSRESAASDLRRTLLGWDRHGFVKWEQLS